MNSLKYPVVWNFFVAALLGAVGQTVALAQGPAPSASGALLPPVQPNPEMQKWISTVEAQWETTYAQEVAIPFDTEKANADQQYSAGLEAKLARSTAAGNLDLTLLWRAAWDQFASAKTIPDSDEPTAPAELKQLRTVWRAQIAKLKKERAAHSKSVLARCDQVLAQAQTALTQKQRIDDALLVKNKREEIALRWSESVEATRQDAAAGEQRAAAAGNIPAALLGTWQVKWPQNGWIATRTFKADGTLAASDAGDGTWQVLGETLVVNLPKFQERYDLPLKPEGTKVISNKNRELIATKEASADGRAVPKVVAPAPKPTLGSASLATMAQFEAQDTVLSPLGEGEKVWSDRDYKFVKITGWRGYQFTRSNAHSPFLRFKVLTNGLVYMACTSRWGSTADPVMQRELKAEKDLLSEGWTRLRRGDIDTGDNRVSFLVFSRMCKAGEQFTYRTEKYAAPILLVKP